MSFVRLIRFNTHLWHQIASLWCSKKISQRISTNNANCAQNLKLSKRPYERWQHIFVSKVSNIIVFLYSIPCHVNYIEQWYGIPYLYKYYFYNLIFILSIVILCWRNEIMVILSKCEWYKKLKFVSYVKNI